MTNKQPDPIDPRALATCRLIVAEHDESWKHLPEKYPPAMIGELVFTLSIVLADRLQAAGMEKEAEIFHTIRDFDEYLGAFRTKRANLRILAEVGEDRAMVPDAVATALRLLFAEHRLEAMA